MLVISIPILFEVEYIGGVAIGEGKIASVTVSFS